MISQLVFLGSLNHIETGFRGLQNGFFGFSSGGYREMGVEAKTIYAILLIFNNPFRWVLQEWLAPAGIKFYNHDMKQVCPNYV